MFAREPTIRLAVLALALVVAGCSGTPRLWSQSEIEDIAEDTAPPAVDLSPLAERVATLEQTVDRLERENEVQRRAIQTLLDQADSNRENIGRLFDNDELWRRHFNYLRAFHGAPPLPEPSGG